MERLKRTSDFDRVFSRGRRIRGEGSKLVYLPNKLGYSRFAVCPVRTYGTAVERNRAKRLAREAYRTLHDRLEPGYDLVFVVYPGSDTFAERCDQLNRLCRKAHLVAHREPQSSYRQMSREK